MTIEYKYSPEIERELMLRLEEANNGILKENNLSAHPFYDQEDGLHVGIYPTPKEDGDLPKAYLAFIPVRIGGHIIPDDNDEVVMALAGIDPQSFHVAGKGRKFLIDNKLAEQAAFMVPLDFIPTIAVKIWRDTLEFDKQ